jgi:ketosteroid isomerase-like protein
MTARMDITNAYLRAIEEGATIRDFFTDDAVQEEFPNRLNPNGGRSDIVEMQARGERGRALVRWQRYDVVSAFESGDTVILEVNWSAAFNVAIASLALGDTMRARFAVFLEFEGDKIRRQRNYDCFDPF